MYYFDGKLSHVYQVYAILGKNEHRMQDTGGHTAKTKVSFNVKLI